MPHAARAWLLAGTAALYALAGGCRGDGAPPPGADAGASTGVRAPAGASASATSVGVQASTAATVTVTATAVVGVSAATATATARPTAAASPAPTPTVSTGAAVLRSITLTPAFGGRRFGRPVELAAYPGGRLFLAEQEGLVTLLGADGTTVGTLLDIRAQVSRLGNEEGFLSLALDPAFAARPYLYAYYSVAGGQRRTRLARFEVTGDTAVRGSELVILEQPQPFANHKGGAIRFGPDGMLYLGLGDGGSQGDPNGNGQRLDTWLGKILRIDVRGASAARPYAVPADNPFTGQAGARPEIWAYGFRNPWRTAFDSSTGALWVGDVGQNAVEEIDVVVRGGNYGWNRFEGDDCYRGPCGTAGLIAPVATYRHSEGCSVTGGVVYRGRAVPALAGWYLYADFCSGRVWAVPVAGGAPVAVLGAASGRAIASWGTDADGEVYALVHGGAVLRVTGAQ